MDLTPELREELEKALRGAFDIHSLRQMLRLKLGYKIEEEIDVAKGFKYVVADLIDLAEDGWLDKLLLAGENYREGQSIRLRTIIAKLGIKPNEKKPSEIIPVFNQAEPARLEKNVRERAPSLPFSDFMKRLNKIGSRICRIEYPEGKPQGTGWLVGPDQLLTAYHVIEKVYRGTNGFNSNDILCRFDYTTDQHSVRNRTCRLAQEWLIDKSSYSQADLAAMNIEPGPEELDYALLRLNEKPADDSLQDGTLRGWIEVSEQAPVMMKNDFVIIPQHPKGRTLELAFGEVLRYNKAVNRVQYDTSTDNGSSGSPCFDINLIPFALHHASGPGENLLYNQGLPMREIIKLMKTRNVTPFWKQ